MRGRTKTRLRKGGALMAGAIALVGTWEGLRLVAYHDIVGVPTVCFGETRGVEMGDSYTREQCEVMLGRGLKEFEAGMRKCLDKPDRIPDGPYIAFLSLSYNIGTSAFCRSTVRKRADAGNMRGACEAITWWNKAGGRVVKGLVNRRAHEKKICLEGIGKSEPVRAVELAPSSPWWRFW